jgi:TolB-like protein
MSHRYDSEPPCANNGRQFPLHSHGITEDIINALSRFRWFFLAARHSSFALKGKVIDIKEIARELDVEYVLTGSVRKWEQQIRVSAQLTDGRTAHQLWSARYDVELVDVFTVQDQIAEQVAGAIEPELLKTESIIAAKRRHVGGESDGDFLKAPQGRPGSPHRVGVNLREAFIDGIS